jgi:hypothetical protein
MDYARLQAGTLTAHEVDHRRRLVLEGEGGTPTGVIVRKGLPQGVAAQLEAHDGAFTVDRGDSTLKGTSHYVVHDPAGHQVAEVTRGKGEHTIALPEGAVLWEHHSVKRPHYAVDGLYGANRKRIHKFVPGASHRPFTADVDPALLARHDAALLVLVAAWLRMVHIDNEVMRGPSRGRGP